MRSVKVDCAIVEDEDEGGDEHVCDVRQVTIYSVEQVIHSFNETNYCSMDSNAFDSL